ncbi:Sugar transferase involved in LPS biosynthesis (colanic, teichoic acid) [Hyunsoonleella jejuensis]|uniref:Sugar transferase involved in LPS biosynthesis (Colanic, teichoic acid) n=1 Tax=Hyunsoonleella jejuensis TaxID=419940 RepID=A0A1H9G865_9FLAO|nr:sugar transferase [Hyunsoonleella jejuensis]SEQ46213.1 Sugar transferase involved in LPS biosynthesis (colanic, teichoic acid) [Hyunsoonleella jejuensis]
MYKNFLKRILDFLASLIALIILSPLIICLIIILTVVNNGKPFFFQRRPGKNSKIFTIIKFKTMKDPKKNESELLNQEQRITKVGGFIRKTSLDELLQLVNVLKGDMSIIGPRPLLIEYLPLYNEEQARRHLVRPGITGWAQVNGRTALSWESRFAHDVWYVDNLSFRNDIMILMKTVQKIFNRKAMSSIENASFSGWEGNTQ